MLNLLAAADAGVRDRRRGSGLSRATSPINTGSEDWLLRRVAWLRRQPMATGLNLHEAWRSMVQSMKSI